MSEMNQPTIVMTIPEDDEKDDPVRTAAEAKREIALKRAWAAPAGYCSRNSFTNIAVAAN